MVSQDTLVLASLGLAALGAGPIVLLDRLLEKEMPSSKLRRLIIGTFLPPSLLSLSAFIFSLYTPLEPARSLLAAAAVVTVVGFGFFLWSFSQIASRLEDNNEEEQQEEDNLPPSDV